jgi:hypothetical protein
MISFGKNIFIREVCGMWYTQESLRPRHSQGQDQGNFSFEEDDEDTRNSYLLN